MSENKPHKNLLSQEEMLDYLEGRIKGPEANRIEKQLLDSSFERDAFDGLSSIPSAEVKKDLNALRERLESRKKYRNPGFLNIAATLSFLIVTFGSIWFVMENALPKSEITMRDDQESQVMELLADSEEDTIFQEMAAVSDSSIQRSNEQSAELPDIGQVVAEAEADLVTSPTEEEVVTSDDDVETEEVGLLAFNTEDADQQDYETASEPAEVLEEPSEQAITESLEVAPSEETAAGSTRSSNQLAEFSRQIETTTLSGVVYYQEDGEALQGVTVSYGGQTTTTDLLGRFELSNITLNAEETVDFSSTNLTSKSVSIENLENINTVMSPSPVFDQKAVILSYGDNSIVSPRPTNGVAAYTEYVNTSLEYPEAAMNAQIEGVVLVKLTISSEGTINNIEVKKSLSSDCDQEAIRLIEEGPQWSPATFNGDPIEGSLRIRFIFEL